MLKRTYVLLALLLLAGCDSTDPVDEGAGEEELITRITLTLTGDGQTWNVTASDPDGDGANPIIETLELASGTVYTGTIGVFDDVNSLDVGAEIAEEADEHQFFFTPSGPDAQRLTVLATDSDTNGLPVGLSFRLEVSAGGAGTAALQVVLSHFDDAPKDGVTRSDETDIDITFPVVIQ